MAHNLITFKGKKEGISIYIKQGKLEDIKNELERKIKKSEKFFKGAKVVEIIGIEGKTVKKDEKKEIEDIITKKYNMVVAEIEKEKEKKRKIKKPVEPTEEENIKLKPFNGLSEGNTKFINATIRSGQLIEFDGNIVIIGDVNPGGEISAKGNIVVLGTLRGVATAGNDGNEDAIVAAFKLNPTQLRIANMITRKPDEDEGIEKSRQPEIARIYDQEIIIESYLTKKLEG